MARTSQTLVLTGPSQALAVARNASGAPPKRGFSAIYRSSYSSSSSSSSDRHDVVEIPEYLNSQETLLFIGFQPDVAKKIFESWQQLQETPDELGYGDDIITSAKCYIEVMGDREDAWLPTQNWRQVLTKMGINRQLADAILDSDFDEIRKSQPASAWVRDSFRISWEFLEGPDGRVRRTPSPCVRRTPSLPDHVDGRTILHKGGAFARFAAAFDDAGTFKISKLCSKSLTDFHRDRNDLFYLTKDLEIAEKCARYAQRRVSLEEGCVLSFAIPNELYANSRQIYGRDWQELVWWSRRPFDLEENSGLPPTSLDDYLQAPVLIGCICGTATDKISRLENSGELTGQYMKKRDGGNESQHVFQSVPILL